MKLQASVRRPDAVAAAVLNGAEEILFSMTEGKLSEWLDMLAYCRLRGIETVLDLGYPHTDNELVLSAENLAPLVRGGLDAVSVADPGALRMARQVGAELTLHADGLFSTLGDVKALIEMGVTRVMLPAHLMREQAAYIAKNAKCEIGVRVLGRVCLSAGDCHLRLRESPARHPCPEACRRMYGFAGKADMTPLSAKEVSLLSHMEELTRIGIRVVRIEGDTSEQVALYTQMALGALNGHIPDAEEMDTLARAVGGAGFSDAYYMNGTDILSGSPMQMDSRAQRLLLAARESCAPSAERPCVPVRFYFLMRAREPARLAVDDYMGHTLTVQGPVPNQAYENGLLEAEANTQWYKTQGTPYKCESARSSIESGLSLPYTLLHDMRREALEKLSAERAKPVKREAGAFKPGVKHLPRGAYPGFTIRVVSLSQLSPQLLALSPERIYIPVQELVGAEDKLHSLFPNGLTGVAAALPRVMGDHEAAQVKSLMQQAYAMGIREALCATLGQASAAQALGFAVHGDLEVTNAQTLKELKRLQFESSLLSPELSFAQLREFSHVLDTEVIAYGRLTQLITARCVLKPHMKVCCCENRNELTDESGQHMPLHSYTGHRNIIYSAQKLWLADKPELLNQMGVWAARLLFTTENPRECVQVLERYKGIGKYAPNSCTRGYFAQDETF